MGWETFGDLPWFMDTECELTDPSDTCLNAGDDSADTTNPDAIEAIGDSQSTTLRNTFNFPEDGVLTFDLYCSSEEFF